MIKFCNYMSFAVKWVKWHRFKNSIVTSHNCLFYLIHRHEGKLQNSKCVLVNNVGTILWLGHDNFTYTNFTHITTLLWIVSSHSKQPSKKEKTTWFGVTRMHQIKQHWLDGWTKHWISCCLKKNEEWV